MPYAVKEAFKTLQGEGLNSGRAAVFCRFAGCNLWSGRESDRPAAGCDFCDTDFVGVDGEGGGRFDNAESLARHIETIWGASDLGRFVVLTGGEPTLQLDAELIDALHNKGFDIAIESNGTLPILAGVDWICISPKGANRLFQTTGDELKLVFPQSDAPPEAFEGMAFQHFLLQPMDGPEIVRNTKLAIDYCLAHPRWRLSVQTHKMIGVK
jgi:7-carboxy-7-deazaguanine synthase (Cx14CxxC type)